MNETLGAPLVSFDFSESNSAWSPSSQNAPLLLDLLGFCDLWLLYHSGSCPLVSPSWLTYVVNLDSWLVES